MKQNKVLALAMAAMGVTGVANGAISGFQLTGVTVYSPQGPTVGILAGTQLGGWIYDDVANTFTAPGQYADLFLVGPTPFYSHVIQGLVLSSTGAPSAATSFVCEDGNFGSVISISTCGNYNFGANGLNQSTVSYGPGLAFSRIIAGDDADITGEPETLASYGGMTLIGVVGATAKLGNTDNNGNLPLATTGYTLEFAATPPAADDGTFYVLPTVAKVMPVGANDVGFSGPVTVTVTTPPTKGVINAISAPGTASGMTITYTANIGQSGVDTFVYDMTDGSPFTDSATVTVNISPDSDSDTIPDANDNCRLTANSTVGTVPNSGVIPDLKSQLDADKDGFGNRCDGDFNNSGALLNVNTTDYTILRSAINKPYSASANAARADLNASGTVDTTDYTIFRALINKLPGPSGLACAGTVPCITAP